MDPKVTPASTFLRRFSRLFRRYDPDRRPYEAAWLWVTIVVTIVLFGVIGYAVPTAITWFERR